MAEYYNATDLRSVLSEITGANPVICIDLLELL